MSGNCNSNPNNGCTDAQTLTELQTFTDGVELHLNATISAIAGIITDFNLCCSTNNTKLTDALSKLQTIIDNAEDCCDAIQAALDGIIDTFEDITGYVATTTTTVAGLSYPCGGYLVENNTLEEDLNFCHQCCPPQEGCDVITCSNLLPGLSYQTNTCEPLCCDILTNVNPLLTVTLLWSCEETTTTTTTVPVTTTTTTATPTTTTTTVPGNTDAWFYANSDIDWVCLDSNPVHLFYNGLLQNGTILYTGSVGGTLFTAYEYVRLSNQTTVYQVNTSSGAIVATFTSYCE